MQKRIDRNDELIPDLPLLTIEQARRERLLKQYELLLSKIDAIQWTNFKMLPPREHIEGQVKMLKAYKEMYHTKN